MAYEETPEQERARLQGWENRALERQAEAVSKIDKHAPLAGMFIVTGVLAGALAIKFGASAEGAQTVVNQVAANGPALVAAFGSAGSFLCSWMAIDGMESSLAESTKSLNEARRRIAGLGDLSL